MTANHRPGTQTNFLLALILSACSLRQGANRVAIVKDPINCHRTVLAASGVLARGCRGDAQPQPPGLALPWTPRSPTTESIATMASIINLFSTRVVGTRVCKTSRRHHHLCSWLSPTSSRKDWDQNLNQSILGYWTQGHQNSWRKL